MTNVAIYNACVVLMMVHSMHDSMIHTKGDEYNGGKTEKINIFYVFIIQIIVITVITTNREDIISNILTYTIQYI